MPYRFLPKVAIADVAFLAESPTPEGLFETSARALTDVMVDRKSVQPKTTKELKVVSEDVDRLLYDFLTELIIMKDVDSLLFKQFKVTLDKTKTVLASSMKGEEIDRARHKLRNDVKAVTMHMFGITKRRGKWRATIVLDI